jgi:hypothetical protein
MPQDTSDVRIYRIAQPDEEIERLAHLDSVRCPRGPLLIAAVGERPYAAMPIDGGPVIADPFRRTAELASLLTLRASQLRPARRRWRIGSPRGAPTLRRAVF